ncbi:uncharacterized protein PpBr36_09192 [Pyricularia pennisetigena]|uniref:uncharacterized protein n=1 Tax=Pyricularia pennisetigena TaxID=1578925 RepID=UPI001153D96D|nr:uncharacterized protein PpBr36_09192 [Pyricularia pennisetigena]TLS21736.1 hypothetical protein PpBr36_09192 [Pyricularia pennisetigena]
MNRIALWTIASCLLVPFTIHASLQAWHGLAGTSSPSGKWGSRATCILAGLLLKIQYDMFVKLTFELRARRLGCLPAKLYPHKDPVLGLDYFLKASRAAAAWQFLPFARENLKTIGHTHYTMALGTWVLHTDEPENIKSILATDFDSWEIAGPRLLPVLPVLGSKSIFTSNGEGWHHARSMLRPSFVRDQVADLACFDRHIGNLLKKIRSSCQEGKVAFDLQELFFLMTMDSSTDFLLGRSTDLLVEASPEAEEFLRAFDYVLFQGAKMARLGPMMMYLPHRKFDADVQTVRSFVRKYVSRAMSERGYQKERSYLFLHELIASGASEEYITDQVLSIILAGRDTTAAALGAAFYFLSQSPDTVAKLRREMLEMGQENPDWETLRGMKYLQNVIKETLRLAPPVATNSRSTSKETILPRGGGSDGKSPVLIPKGTSCRWSSYALYRRQDIYGPDAEEFRPERWEDLRVGWEYTPFSGGPRICIGQQFALTQMSLTIFRILQNFDKIESKNDGPMALRASVSVSLADPGCLVSMTPSA